MGAGPETETSHNSSGFVPDLSAQVEQFQAQILQLLLRTRQTQSGQGRAAGSQVWAWPGAQDHLVAPSRAGPLAAGVLRPGPPGAAPPGGFKEKRPSDVGQHV